MPWLSPWYDLNFFTQKLLLIYVNSIFYIWGLGTGDRGLGTGD
ncbi:MAG: hypothetical protein QNJ49_16270 [Mastigocoleus sp. MO_167.B18]|nr:hypothetical protein [Mastigocoleus sp. MO_167.B18]